MKNLKKLASVALALVMAMALMVPAFAAEAQTGTITIKNPSNTPEGVSHTYNVYRVFDMTRANDTATSPVSYTATTALKTAIENSSTISSYFSFTAINGDAGHWTVAAAGAFKDNGNDSDAAKAVAEFLSQNTNLLTKISGEGITVTGPNATQTIQGTEYGYYFVDSATGSLFMLDSYSPNVTITDKNEDPTNTKEMTTTGNIKIGDKIDYKIEIKVVPGSVDYVLHDKMTGLTLDANSFAITVNNTTVATSNYTIETDTSKLTNGDTFAITFKADYLNTLAKDSTIVVTYKATINDITAIPEGSNVTTVKNEAKVSYGNNQTTTGETPETNFYAFDLVKYDGNKNLLDGATFELYNESDVSNGAVNAGAQPIKFEKINNDYVASSDATESSIVVTDGMIRVAGLNGTYYLKETVAPNGYNKLDTLTEVILNDTNKNLNASVSDGTYSNGGVGVENLSGAELPATGGMGTTIFYAVGGVLLAGSAILFITKKRMGE